MIGVVSDIHGNHEALETVLDDMGSVEGILCCGDVIGYGPDPLKCIRTIQEKADACVIGNHELALIRGQSFNSTTARAGLEVAREQLHNEDFDWIGQLPRELTRDTLHVTHSYPKPGETKRVMPDQLERFFPHVEGDVFVYGHTHHPVSTTVNDVLFVNPGSVGQPRDGDPRASYALLDIEERACELNRVAYDVESTCRRADEENLPAEFKERIRNGD